MKPDRAEYGLTDTQIHERRYYLALALAHVSGQQVRDFTDKSLAELQALADKRGLVVTFTPKGDQAQ